MVVLTINSLEGKSIERFSLETSNKWGLGKKNLNNGLLFLIAVQDRKFRIELGFGLERFLSNSLLKNIFKIYTVPYFKKGDYSKGVHKTTLAIINKIRNQLCEKFDKFVKENGVRKRPLKDALFANPFVYEGETIAIASFFYTMLSPTQAVFRMGGDPVIVSKIPKGLFRSENVKVILAARVLGKTEFKMPLLGPMLVPHLKFVDVYFCSDWICSDIITK